MQIPDGNKGLAKLANGPVDNTQRSCTNLLCAVVYTLMLLSILFVGVYANITGNVELIDQGYDPDNRACGKGELKDYPFLYFVALNPDLLWQTVCVQDCPTIPTAKPKHLQTMSGLKCAVNSIVTTCSSVTIYNSIKYARRVCIPTDAEQYKIVQGAIQIGFLHHVVSDVIEAKFSLVIFILIAIDLTFSLIYLLKYCSKIGCLSTIIIMVIISIFFGYYCYSQYRVYSTTALSTLSKEYLLQAIFFFSLALGTIILTCGLFKRINLAIAMIKAASNFVSNNSFIMLVPVFLIFAQVAFTTIFMYIVLQL